MIHQKSGEIQADLQYAVKYQEKYPGGIYWLKAREEDVGTQIVQWGRILDIKPPEKLNNLEAQVQYCWTNWDKETSLIVFDDVPNYDEYYQENIVPYLPPRQEKFKVLMTSRHNPGANLEKIDLDVLSAEVARELIKAIAGEARIEAELELAGQLCEWLGYLPLGLELVGRYLKRHKTLSLETIIQRLEKQKLAAKALLEPKKKEMTAQLGVAAAFELSWQELNSKTQELGSYISLFDSEPFIWSWVEKVWIKSTDEEEREELEELRDEELADRNLLKLTIDQDSQSPTEPQYQLHSLIAEYFRAKLEELEEAEVLKQKFCQQMLAIPQSIPETPTQEDIRRVALAIPHLSVVVKELTKDLDALDAENILAIMDLCDFLLDFPEINTSNITEIVIAGYEQGLEIIDRLDEAEDWALIQYNLGNAYRKRVEGERASNIERAIGYYQKALQVFNAREYPIYWAMTQNNLAIAYSDRICGERGDNLEIAHDVGGEGEIKRRRCQGK